MNIPLLHHPKLILQRGPFGYCREMATATLPMTREEIRAEVETIRKVSKKIKSSKKSAEQFLVQFGVLTKDGKLKAKYR